MFTGSIVALITPMNEEGNVCVKGLEKLIEYHIASGTSAIVSVGTTGESTTLSHEEHYRVVMTTLEIADEKIPVIAGTGSNSTSEGVILTRKFEGTGIIGCLTVTPYYNRPTQEGMYQHFKSIAQNTALPQILYNVPSRTSCDLLPETVARLAEIDNIIAIKDATGDLTRVGEMQDLVGDNFILLSGDDITALDFMRLGGKGIISVTANIAARDMADLCLMVEQGRLQEALSINRRLSDLHKALFLEPNPAPVKWAARELGLIISDSVRLPMLPISSLTEKKIRSIISKPSMVLTNRFNLFK